MERGAARVPRRRALACVSAPVWELGSTRIEDFSQVVTYHANLISQRLGYNR